MPRKKKTTEPVVETNYNYVLAPLEDIADSTQTLERKIVHINNIVNQTKYILDRQHANELMHFDAYTWLKGNMSLIEDLDCLDEITDISNALQAIMEQLVNQNSYSRLLLEEEIMIADEDLPF